MKTPCLILAMALGLVLYTGCGKEAKENEVTTVPPGTTATEGTLKATKTGKAQTTCPVMGGAIDQGIYTDHKGKRVYFCCAGCADTFKKNPEKYLKQMAADNIVLETLSLTREIGTRQ